MSHIKSTPSHFPAARPPEPQKFGDFPQYTWDGGGLPERVLLTGAQFPPQWTVWEQPDNISCTSFAVSGLMMYRHHRRHVGPDAEFEIDDPYDHERGPCVWYQAYVERETCSEVGVSAGIFPHAAIGALARYGACPDADWPSAPDFWRDQHRFAEIANHPEQVAAAQRAAQHALPLEPRMLGPEIAADQKRDTDLFRACLAAGNPFVFAASLYPAVGEKRAPGDIPPPDLSIPMPQDSHSLLCIGYDDDFVSPEGVRLGRRFLIRNSEGPGKGWSGYQSLAPEWLESPYATFGLFTVVD